MTNETFACSILKMQEAGLIDRWRQKWWTAQGSCDNNGPTSDAKTLDLPSLLGVFLVVIVGFLAAAVALIGEWLICKMSRGFSEAPRKTVPVTSD